MVAVVPPDRISAALFVPDKIMHGLTFLGLTLWFAGAYEPRRYLWLAAALLGFGAGIEFFQAGLTHRSAELMDWLADGLGIAAGLAMALAGLSRWCYWIESSVLGFHGER